MTGCAHDPTYRTDNEANGGTGCPLCNSIRAGYILKSHMVIDAARAKGEAMADAYHAHQCGAECGLSAADIADIEARCEETANVMEDNR
jgi:hypothetical protein